MEQVKYFGILVRLFVFSISGLFCVSDSVLSDDDDDDGVRENPVVLC